MLYLSSPTGQMTITQICSDYLAITIAVVVGLVRFRKLDPFCRILFYQATTYLIMDAVALAIALETPDNRWFYNMHIPIETLLLTMAAGVLLNNQRSHLILGVFASFVILIFIADLFIISGFTHFAYHAAIAEGFLMTSVCSILIYRFFTKKYNTAIAIAASGMILYFACSIPHLSIMFYFHERNPELNQLMFQYIIVTLSNIRYLAIAIAFIIINRKRPTLIST